MSLSRRARICVAGWHQGTVACRVLCELRAVQAAPIAQSLSLLRSLSFIDLPHRGSHPF
jgi:hypothetical protein